MSTSIRNALSHLTRTHLIAIGVTVLAATAICVGVVVSKSSSKKATINSFSEYKDKLLQLDHATQWKSFTTETVSLDEAFEAGEDENGKTIYPCRANYQRDLISGTFRPDNLCWVTYGGRAVSSRDFDLLVTKNSNALLWLPNSNGKAYNGAVVSGFTFNRDELLAARVDFYSYHSVGKIHDRYKSAYVPRGRVEYETKSYEVLCAADYAL